jgi:hydroxymethylglutaryl-CoA reductase
MATEEPSVIAAASFAARIIARGGGISTDTGPPLMTAQVYFMHVSEEGEDALRMAGHQIQDVVSGAVGRMAERGGGYRGFDVERVGEFVRLQIYVDVRDAMGANVVNTAAEAVRPVAAEISGGEGLMAILTNAAEGRLTWASFSIPVSSLSRGGFTGAEAAERIVAGYRIAAADPSRAVTHNKGIMNGVTAIALATGNDTRGLEAAVHAYAARTGVYRPVSSFEVVDDRLEGRIEMPVPVATVGGAVSYHPVADMCLQLLGSPRATDLSRLAAAVGLAQNFAAVYALVTEGIQRGHMAKHAQRVAWKEHAAHSR